MKYFRMSYEEIVFNRSYINIILLNRSIPSYDFDRDDDNDNKVERKVHKDTFQHESQLFQSLM